MHDDISIQKDTKEDMERCAVEFIQFITSEGLPDPSIRATLMRPINLTHFSLSAAENASGANCKTLHGNVVLRATKDTGYEYYAEALRPYLEGFNRRERKDIQHIVASTSKRSCFWFQCHPVTLSLTSTAARHRDRGRIIQRSTPWLTISHLEAIWL